MAKKRPHTSVHDTAMPRIRDNELNTFPNAPKRGFTRKRSRTPHQPSGEVDMQKHGGGGSSPHPRTPYERGFNPDLGHRRERNPPGGRQKGMSMSDEYSAMPKTGHQSATAAGELARPGSELRSATMDARSSVPASIQESNGGSGRTTDRFTSLDYGKVRFDNAEVDAGTGTGRRAQGNFRGNRRM